jgi:hypothetical protein
MMEEYVVVTEANATDLEIEVNARLDGGWRLLGGVAVAVNNVGAIWVQALTRKSER